MLADTFVEERLGTVMGTVIMSHTIGFVLGPALGGILYDRGGTLAPFYLCSLFGVLTLIGVLWIEEPITTTRSPAVLAEESSPLLPERKGQMFQLVKNRRIISCVICCFVTSAALSGIEPALPIYLQEKYHVSISVVGGNYSFIKKNRQNIHTNKILSYYSCIYRACFTFLFGSCYGLFV